MTELNSNNAHAYPSTHLGHILSTEGTLVLSTQNPHTRHAFKADRMIAGPDGVNLHVTKAHATGVTIPAISCRVRGRSRAGSGTHRGGQACVAGKGTGR